MYANYIKETHNLDQFKPVIGHLGLLAQFCLKYALEFDQTIKAASEKQSATIFPVLGEASSPNSYKSTTPTTNSCAVPTVQKAKQANKSEKIKINEEIKRKKLKLEKLNRKLEKKLELIKQTKLKKNKNSHSHHTYHLNENDTSKTSIKFKPYSEEFVQPKQPEIENQTQLDTYIQTKSFIENFIKLSNANNSSNNPPLMNNLYTNHSNPFQEHSMISNEFKAKRFSPYDLSLRTTHKRTGQFQHLVNECYAPKLFK